MFTVYCFKHQKNMNSLLPIIPERHLNNIFFQSYFNFNHIHNKIHRNRRTDTMSEVTPLAPSEASDPTCGNQPTKEGMELE